VPPDLTAPATPVAATEAADPLEAAPTEAPARRGRSRRKKPADSTAQAELAPLPYAGPTPADPFGGGLDIFDALERVESLHAGSTAGPVAPPEAVDGAANTDAAGVGEPAVGAPVQPVVIAENAPAAERKRGWWRR